MSSKLAVIGAGGWGTAVAVLLANKGMNVSLGARRREFALSMAESKENLEYLPGIRLPDNLSIATGFEDAARGANVVVFATPSKAVRESAQILKSIIAPEALLVSLSKGLERETFKRSSEVLAEVLDRKEGIVALSGPNHAEEVARSIPSATVAACANLEAAQAVQNLFMTPTFRVYSNPDIVGVEIAGALKNIIALAAGICDGLGYGDNTKAALMTRGLTEIARLGFALGADSLTFAGLAGIGDLIATCTSKHSRNWRTGYALGQGQGLETILKGSGVVVEGVNATEVARALAERVGVEMPITKALHQVLFEGFPPSEAVSSLMLRAKTHEVEEVVSVRNWFSR